MIFLDVVSEPLVSSPGFIFLMLIIAFGLILLGIGIYFLVKYLKGKDKN